MLLRGWSPVLLSAPDVLRQKVWIYIASQVCVLCGLHSLPLPLLTLDVPLVYHPLQPRWGSTPSGRLRVEWLVQVWQGCFSTVAGSEQRLRERQLLWRGLDTSAFQSDLITSSSVALRFCSISFSKQTPEQASRVVNPNDFCSHLKADALKCELSQLLSQRVSLDMEFGCVYYSRLLAVKTINLYLCNTYQTLQSPRAALIECCPFSLGCLPMPPVLKAWCYGTWWNLCGLGGSDRS